MFALCLDAQLRINFNMSFLDLPCEYLSVDALDILGSNRVNITGNADLEHLPPTPDATCLCLILISWCCQPITLRFQHAAALLSCGAKISAQGRNKGGYSITPPPD